MQIYVVQMSLGYFVESFTVYVHISKNTSFPEKQVKELQMFQAQVSVRIGSTISH